MKSFKLVKFCRRRASYTSQKIINGELKNTVPIIIKLFLMVVAFATVNKAYIFYSYLSYLIFQYNL